MQQLLADALEAARALQQELGNLPCYREFISEPYEHALLARWEAAEQWASSNRPSLVFVGDIHAPCSDLPARRAHQEWIFQQVTAAATQPCIVGVEAYGAELPLTFERWIKILLKQNPVKLKKGDVERHFRQTNDAVVRLMKRNDLAVICAEEAPAHALNQQLNTVLWQNPYRHPCVTKDDPDYLRGLLAARIVELRSWLAIMRTLEWLRKRDRSLGILVQGRMHAAHAKHICIQLGCRYREVIMQGSARPLCVV